MKVGHLTRSSLTTATSIGGAFAVLLAFVAVARADYIVNACGPNVNKVFTATLPSNQSIEAADLGGSATCSALGGHLGLMSNSAVSTSQGTRGAWQANAPAGLEIVGASATASLQTTNGDGHFATSVYWQGGSAALPDPYINNNGITDPGVTINGAWTGFASPFFGFQMVCGANPGPGQSPYGPGIPVTNSLDASPVTLTVHETVGPSLSAPAQYVDTTAFLAHSASVVRSHGFHRSGDENATWRAALSRLEQELEPAVEDQSRASEIRDWARQLKERDPGLGEAAEGAG